MTEEMGNTCRSCFSEDGIGTGEEWGILRPDWVESLRLRSNMGTFAGDSSKLRKREDLG